jgi:hypothetical protein
MPTNRNKEEAVSKTSFGAQRTPSTRNEHNDFA